MASTTVETIIANPARKRGNMTAKQIKFFGTKRQRAALKRRRPKAKRRHVTRAKSNPARKRRAVAAAPKRRRKTVHRARAKRTRRKNPGEIISLVLGNPAKRRKSVARTKRRKASVRRRSAGRRVARRRSNPGVVRHHRRHRRNPGTLGFNVQDMLALGGGAVLGGTLPTVASQAVLGAKNTGWMGYLSNLAATFLLAWGAGRFVKGKQGSTLVMGIVAGGIGSVIKRAITDYSILGSYGQQLGFGDYMVSNWVAPQRMVDGLYSAEVQIPAGWAPTTIAAPMTSAGDGMGMYAPLYGVG